jgi:hypothetical protein
MEKRMPLIPRRLVQGQGVEKLYPVASWFALCDRCLQKEISSARPGWAVRFLKKYHKHSMYEKSACEERTISYTITIWFMINIVSLRQYTKCCRSHTR